MREIIALQGIHYNNWLREIANAHIDSAGGSAMSAPVIAAVVQETIACTRNIQMPSSVMTSRNASLNDFPHDLLLSSAVSSASGVCASGLVDCLAAEAAGILRNIFCFYTMLAYVYKHT